ncbi:PREDICTED: transcription factor bHLH82-like [Lupinus angustifolius]|uniref:transcription factor bHLH82-like n=1 Tax=Lupinus angustifolius TaxID=3871 RepID=UPI00092E225F|nr:PREDICTED: transcription factor bHLH82-like [Lupinus angustifolius]
MSCSPWTCIPNYVEYLAQSSSSTYLPKDTSEAITACNYYHPTLATINNVNEVNATDRNFFYNNIGKHCAFKTPHYSSTQVDISKVGFWRTDEGKEAHQEANQYGSTKHHHLFYADSHASWTEESVGDKHNVSQLDPRVMVGEPALLPKKQKTYAVDRLRRQRIADNLKALHELLPIPAERGQAYVLDDIIDYVKYLQLQIKEISGTRLQTEPTSIPFIFHEGYGHYIEKQMLNEPLEEMMGKLLEENPAAATQLLESKGLFLMPITLVEDLGEAMQMLGGNALL